MSIRYQFCFMFCLEKTSYKIICQCRRPQFKSWVGKIHWKRDRLPTPVFLPGKSHGLRSLAGYSPMELQKSQTWLSNETTITKLQQMDKKAVVHIHKGILLSHLKGYIWIRSNEVDETGAYYTEWSKPERKTPIQYTNAYIWNLERW